MAVQEKGIDRQFCVVARIPERQVVTYAGNLEDGLEPGLRETIRVRPMRHRFLAIAPMADGLWLQSSSKGRWWRVALNDAGDTMVLQSCSSSPPDEIVLPFADLPLARDVGYTLRRATWQNGSSAVLDSRGMLHLKSAGATIPEATIVLAEGALGGWLADGSYWGFGYFAPDRMAQVTGAMFADILQRFLRELP